LKHFITSPQVSNVLSLFKAFERDFPAISNSYSFIQSEFNASFAVYLHSGSYNNS